MVGVGGKIVRQMLAQGCSARQGQESPAGEDEALDAKSGCRETDAISSPSSGRRSYSRVDASGLIPMAAKMSSSPRGIARCASARARLQDHVHAAPRFARVPLALLEAVLSQSLEHRAARGVGLVDLDQHVPDRARRERLLCALEHAELTAV